MQARPSVSSGPLINGTALLGHKSRRHTMSKFLMIGLTAAGSLGLSTPAFAQGMPAGARQWILVYGNYAQTTGAVGFLPYPSPNYVTNPTFVQLGCTNYANGGSTANRMYNSYARWRTDGMFLANSMVDTYTISGPPGTQGTPVT